MMIRQFMRSRWFKLLNLPLHIFYNKKYLRGYYYENKVMGWVWAWKAVPFKLIGVNRKLPFPADSTVRIHNAKNIIFDRDDIHIFQSPGTYFNNFSAKIYIGKGVYIAPNVGIITANHDFNDLHAHNEGKNVVIGDKSWIGMNAVILPGVTLGEKTIVGAGAIVTKSFPEGNVVLAGNPAKKIKELSVNEAK
ncbi:acyltransferase [Staphylococcus agnetis]|nr:acyltransferase [Staphylococcus agnetis]MCO4337968.1 acyltransferase [Staphylococcus agnetis]MCO4340255.1 acyltransferase [Staphylococcus agnetis]MCO4343093.1 acyltransferase [Staphylococcus agnetis]MCO4345038.1 acyltransferase [Staphylococcus agnetis]MCO4347219.1 acyltransferase [Staphylococcus agnetis]